ncbi:hypothetical protein [Halostella pelagica]|uniref:hypothetical protein n=1 Tax=Halostella pelagica TaxID=2583824 RepID=UPI00143CE3EB|nr:hypothetical protein [Halostella pelagica]
MNTKKVALGVVLLAVSSAILLATGVLQESALLIPAAIASLGMAAGALLVGTAGSGRPV